MCLATREFNGFTIPCRECWQCRRDRVNDYVGRCIAEQKISTETLVPTFTIAGNDYNSVILYYRDIQLMLKRLRRKGYKVRYMIAGEYGEHKGRPHWHGILFFKGKAPQIEIDRECYNWEHWPHGFTHFQEPKYKTFRYCMKYAIKSLAEGSSEKVYNVSKEPPLGYDWFKQYAQAYIEAGIPPRHFYYTFPDVLTKKGKPRRFLMTRTTRKNFVTYFEAEWLKKWGTPPKYIEYMQERIYYLDDRQIRLDRERKREEQHIDQIIQETLGKATQWHAAE